MAFIESSSRRGGPRRDDADLAAMLFALRGAAQSSGCGSAVRPL